MLRVPSSTLASLLGARSPPSSVSSSVFATFLSVSAATTSPSSASVPSAFTTFFAIMIIEKEKRRKEKKKKEETKREELVRSQFKHELILYLWRLRLRRRRRECLCRRLRRLRPSTLAGDWFRLGVARAVDAELRVTCRLLRAAKMFRPAMIRRVKDLAN
jgi:hypothetical protein